MRRSCQISDTGLRSGAGTSALSLALCRSQPVLRKKADNMMTIRMEPMLGSAEISFRTILKKPVMTSVTAWPTVSVVLLILLSIVA
ncbi:hypothetical protein D3C81_1759730 [compost metagenome]